MMATRFPDDDKCAVGHTGSSFSLRVIRTPGNWRQSAQPNSITESHHAARQSLVCVQCFHGINEDQWCRRVENALKRFSRAGDLMDMESAATLAVSSPSGKGAHDLVNRCYEAK